MKKQILKQLKFGSKLLQEISREHKKGNFFKFGKFAFIVQQKEVKRLQELLKKYN